MNQINLFIFLLLITTGIHAKGIYQTNDAFVAEAFDHPPPSPQFVWFTGELKTEVARILEHRPTTLRTRYWQQAARTVWILEEIGKEKPITVGIIVNKQQIEQVKVLAFRESRGWEVRREDFTKQFIDTQLNDNKQLTKPIDGISGATLSVSALTRLARLALYLDSQVNNVNDSQ